MEEASEAVLIIYFNYSSRVFLTFVRGADRIVAQSRDNLAAPGDDIGGIDGLASQQLNHRNRCRFPFAATYADAHREINGRTPARLVDD